MVHWSLVFAAFLAGGFLGVMVAVVLLVDRRDDDEHR